MEDNEYKTNKNEKTPVSINDKKTMVEIYNKKENLEFRRPVIKWYLKQIVLLPCSFLKIF